MKSPKPTPIRSKSLSEKNKESLAVLLSLDKWELMNETTEILSYKNLYDLIFDRVDDETISFEKAKEFLKLESKKIAVMRA